MKRSKHETSSDSNTGYIGIQGNPNSAASSFSLGYLFRRVEEEIDRIGMEAGEPGLGPELAGRLAELLQAKAMREMVGHPQRMPAPKLSGSASKRNVRSRGQALHVRPHVRRPLSQAARNRIARAQRIRWAKQKSQRTVKRTVKGNTYARMRFRMLEGNDPKLKAKAVDWFKRNYPDSTLLKKAA